MSHRFSVFLSCDSNDFAVAATLRNFLSGLFPSVDVLISGTCLETPASRKRLRIELMSSVAVVGVASPRSIKDERLCFDLGTGYLHGKSLLVCVDGLTPAKVGAPLDRLPAFEVTERGMLQFIGDLARLGGVIMPPDLTSLDETLGLIGEFFTARKYEGREKNAGVLNTLESARDALDITTGTLHRRHKRQLKLLAVKSILNQGQRLKLPSKERLTSMQLPELLDLAGKHNIAMPEREYLMLRCFEENMPSEFSPLWKKMNAYKIMETVDAGLQRFERLL